MIRIKKAKVKITGVHLEYEEQMVFEDDRDPAWIEKTAGCPWPPHADLISAFDKLVKHLAALCEQPENEQNLSTLTATGYTIGGEDEHEGVTLIGQKRLAHNRVLNLVSPFTKWQDEHNGYRYAAELHKAIWDCETHLEEYLEGKAAPAAQLKMLFDQEEMA